MALFLRICKILLALAFFVLAYFFVIWVLQQLGIVVPEHILRIVFVILGLMFLIGALSGKFDQWWVLAVILSFSACGVQQYTASTTASANKDGFNYTSNKNQENLHAIGEIDPTTGKMKFDVTTTASTPEAAIAAALQSNLELQKQLGALLQAVMPLVTKAAGAAAAGS